MSPAASPREFDRLFARYRAPVLRHLARMVPAAEAEDLAQEAFAKAAAGLGRFRGEASVSTWLFRIATRTALDHLRSRRHAEMRRTDRLTDSTEGDRSATDASRGGPFPGSSRLEREEMGHCIREFVDRLPRAYAQILALKDFDGRSCAEIAARLGISLEAAKIRLHRARAALRSEIERGCELYRTESDTLGCDRKIPCGCGR